MTNLNLLYIILFAFPTIFGLKLVNSSYRWLVILITSLLSYALMIEEKIFIIIFLALVLYIGSPYIEKKKRTWPLILTALVPLIIFKISSTNPHFYQYTTNHLTSSFGSGWIGFFQIIGISYITFNAISYLIDLKKGYIAREENFLKLLLYLVYFPIVFSGPLHRYKYLKNAFDKIEVSDKSISKGLRLILWGLFKNLVLAKRLFILLNILINSELSGIYFLLAGFVFFLYIYCNFSSFIDFFQGLSELFGVRLNNNFSNRVYFSASRQKFWSGWHITLNHWFRDYFFYSLAKYDRKQRYIDLILLITFILIALWHELSIALLIWGVLNGTWIVLEKKVRFQQWRFQKVRRILGIIYHLGVSSIIALVFISPDIFELIDRVIFNTSVFPSLKDQIINVLIIIFCFFVMDFHFIKAKQRRFDEYLENQSVAFRWFTYLKLGLLILIFAKDGGLDNYYVQF